MREAMVAHMGGRLMSVDEAAQPILFFALPERWYVNEMSFGRPISALHS